MRPVQAENVILNKKNGTTPLVIPFHTDLSVALWPTIPGHTGALATTTSNVGMRSIWVILSRSRISPANPRLLRPSATAGTGHFRVHRKQLSPDAPRYAVWPGWPSFGRRI